MGSNILIISLICAAAVLTAGAAQSQTSGPAGSSAGRGYALQQTQPDVPKVLYLALAAAPTVEKAAFIATEIERLWRMSDSDTVALLFEHAASLQSDGELEAALAKLDALVRLAPDAAEAWAMRGEVRRALGETEKAFGDFEMAVEIEPRHYRAWAAMARFRDGQGKVREALEAYRRAASIYPLMQGLEPRIKALEAVPEETQL
jgi:tetratricopeptide (TPR) repeat protein